MSGGSFDYLYARASLGELASNLGMLHAMREALTQYPGAERALAATDDLLLRIKALDLELSSQQMNVLRTVWHAVEWDRSGDYSKDQVLESLELYENTVRVLPMDAYCRIVDAALASMPGGAEAWPWLRGVMLGVAIASANLRERTAAR